MADSAEQAAREQTSGQTSAAGPMQGQLDVKPHRPGQTRIVAAVAIVASLVVGYSLFEVGRRQGGFDTLEAGQEREDLQAQIGELTRGNDELRQKVALLET